MSTFRFKTEEEANTLSAEITWAQASPLIAAYATRPDAIRVLQPSGAVNVLKALRFKKEHILALLEPEAVTDLYLMFANSPQNAQNITIVAGGLTDGSQGGLLLKNLLYDYCEPCPTKCATNVSE